MQQWKLRALVLRCTRSHLRVDVARSLERVAAIHLEAAGGGRLEEALVWTSVVAFPSEILRHP